MSTMTITEQETALAETREQRERRKRGVSGACLFPHGDAYHCESCGPKPERPTLDAEGSAALTEEYSAALDAYAKIRGKVETATQKATAVLAEAEALRERAEKLERRAWKYGIDVPTLPPTYGTTPEGRALAQALARRS